MFIRLTPLLWLALVSAEAQRPLAPNEIPNATRLFAGASKAGSLNCSIRQTEPSLDFTFRYDAGYFIACRFGQFEPGESLFSYLRIQPQEGAPVWMGETFELPQIPPDVARKIDRKKLNKLEVGMSGAFAVGEGRYSVEVVLLDKRGRMCRKRWTLSAVRKRKEQALVLALKPLAVEPLVSSPWDGKLVGDGAGVRLTILLHAVPMNPFASKLYAWDRAFLLQSLASLLRQVPCRSVRIVAFNLDRQQEIFRQDQFDAAGFTRLSRVLKNLELGTVSYKALQRYGWPELLVRLTQQELTAKDSSDAVIFLGPTTRFDGKVSEEMLKESESSAIRFVYFEYYPWLGYEFPDAIERLTRDLHGTVYKMHSASDLGLAIKQMLVLTKPTAGGTVTPN